MIILIRNRQGAAGETGHIYPSWAPDITPDILVHMVSYGYYLHPRRVL